MARRRQKSSPVATLVGLVVLVGLPVSAVKSCMGSDETASSYTTSVAPATTSTAPISLPTTSAPAPAFVPTESPSTESYTPPSSPTLPSSESSTVPDVDVPNPDLPGHAPHPHLHGSGHGHIHFHL